MARTMLQLRHAVSRRVNDLWVGTITTDPAAAATSLIDTKRVEVDGFFKGAHIHVGADSTADDTRITDSDQSTTTLTVNPGVVTDHPVLVAYEIHRLMDVSEYNSLIEDAIIDAGPETLLDNLEYTGITLAADDYEYALPRNFRYISEIWIADSDGSYEPHKAERIDLKQVTVIPGTVRKLRFNPVTFSLTAGRSVRVLGQGIQELPTEADTSPIYIDAAFVMKHTQLSVMRQLSLTSGAQAAAAIRLERTLAAEVQLAKEAMTATSRPKAGSLAAYP